MCFNPFCVFVQSPVRSVTLVAFSAGRYMFVASDTKISWNNRVRQSQISQSVSQTVIDQSVCQSVSQTVIDQSVSQSDSCSADQPVSQSVSQSQISQSVRQSQISQSVSRSVSHRPYCIVCPMLLSHAQLSSCDSAQWSAPSTALAHVCTVVVWWPHLLLPMCAVKFLLKTDWLTDCLSDFDWLSDRWRTASAQTHDGKCELRNDQQCHRYCCCNK